MKHEKAFLGARFSFNHRCDGLGLRPGLETSPVTSEPTEPAPTEAQVEERTIRIAMPIISSSRQIDLHDAAGNIGLLENMYESLVGTNIETLAPYPLVAEIWSPEDNNTRDVFTLRQGVKFPDGIDLTSDDVNLSFK